MTYTQPFFPLLVSGAALAFVAHFRKPSTRRRQLLGLAIFGLFFFSWPPVAWLMSLSLEAGYRLPSKPTAETEVDAIVVLAGYVEGPTPRRVTPTLGYDTYRRCLHASDLYSQWQRLPVLVCGGGGGAYAMRDALQQWGVPADAIWLESRSARTYENALYAAGILRTRGIGRVLLVTDGYHLRRADLCFRRQGIDVVASPSSLRTDTFPVTLRQLLPGSTAIRHNETTLHEWLGIVWYWCQGWV